MKIEKLVIGTTNPGKLSEWAELLAPEISTVGLDRFPTVPKFEETGETFAENVRIKATSYARALEEFVFADDGGYEVDALGGAPGVKSRRILPGDKEGTDKELIDYVLEKLKGLRMEKRGVKLTTAVAISDPQGNIVYEDLESSVGVVAEKPGPVLVPGYPFRTIHYLAELGKTYAELTGEEHKKFSHKRKIAERLKTRLSGSF